MKKPWIIAGAVVAAAVLFGGAAATVASARMSGSAPTVAEASAEPASVAALDRHGSFTLAEAEDSDVVGGSRVVAGVPEAVTAVSVALDQSEIEQYWLWASGVEVTAHGLTPGSSARIGITFSSGDTKRWAPVTVDADGTIVTRVRTLDVDPENTRPEAGLAQISVTTSAGEAGSALLTVVAPSGPALQVSTSPNTISQDAFLDAPVTIHASGFPPMTTVFFNLGLPDTTMMTIGENEGLHSDENGEFSYDLQMMTVNSQVGTWTISLQSSDGARSGTATFEVTAGRERAADKTIATAASQISVAEFSTEPGLGFTLAGFLPFDTYELTLTTSRGYVAPLGISRTNGEGRHTNAVKSPPAVPEGEYTLVARSTTTGDYAQASFRVTGNPELPDSDIALSPSTVSADELADPAGGVTLTGSGIQPGTMFRVSLRDAAWARQPLTAGADAYATVGEDGTLALTLVSLEPLAEGTYTVWVDAGGGVAAYNLHLPLRVTPSPTAAPDDVPHSAPPVAPSAPSSDPTAATEQPRPRTDAQTPPAPAPSLTPAPAPFEDDMPPRSVPVPTAPAL